MWVLTNLEIVILRRFCTRRSQLSLTIILDENYRDCGTTLTRTESVNDVCSCSQVRQGELIELGPTLKYKIFTANKYHILARTSWVWNRFSLVIYNPTEISIIHLPKTRAINGCVDYIPYPCFVRGNWDKWIYNNSKMGHNSGFP